MKALVTGSAGFIGSHLVDALLEFNDMEQVISIDNFSEGSNYENVNKSNKHVVYNVNMGNTEKVFEILTNHKPTMVFDLASQSHVDRSITGPSYFVENNIQMFFNFAWECYKYFNSSQEEDKKAFRYIHISTDEVFGSLDDMLAPPFTEENKFAPNSVYSASKASQDLLIRALHHTYGFPAIVTHCSNNYGPRQDGEKLIPTIMKKILSNNPIPVYGSGTNVREWIYVKDHVAGIIAAAKKGKIGESYNLGSNYRLKNIEVIAFIGDLLGIKPVITFVEDRKGHDLKYAINTAKAKKELGWTAETTLHDGFLETIKYYDQLAR